MNIEFSIMGKVYPAKVKRVKGKLKVFFNTYDVYHKNHGFDLPNFCCNKIKCRWRSLKNWKEDLVTHRIKSVVILHQ